MAYTEDELLGLSVERRQLLANLVGVGLAIADSSGAELGQPLVDAWLEDPAAGTLKIDTALVQCEIPVAGIGLEDLAFEAGGIGRRIRVFRLPEDNPHRRVEIERRIALRSAGDNALYVCLTQEDGHLVWSSPIYIFRAPA